MFGTLKRNRDNRKSRGNGAITFAGRVILGSIFIYAGLDKILHPVAFAEIVYNYQILPDVLVNLTAIVLPWMEITLGIFLILGIWIHGAIFLGNLLLLAFFSAILFNLGRGLDISCGCFSTAEAGISGAPMAWYVARDGILLMLGLWLFFCILLQEPHSEGVKDASLVVKK